MKFNLFFNLRFIILLGAVSSFMTSCELINPDEDAPVYILVDTFTFDASPTLQEMGPSKSTNIKDAWLIVDNKVVGVFELPAKIPVLESGNKPVVISPGILLNGIKATRSPYPFYEPYFDTSAFIPGTNIKYDPTYNYLKEIGFDTI